jgi:hypothetical protein
VDNGTVAIGIPIKISAGATARPEIVAPIARLVPATSWRATF